MQDWKELYKIFSDKLLGDSSFLYLSVVLCWFFFFLVFQNNMFLFFNSCFPFLNQKSNTIHSHHSLNPLDNLAG